MEFGTNTGRQGTYDPRDPRQSSMAMQRLRQLEDEWGPDRLQIGFTGETGLAKNDAQGWSRMLNAQTEAKNIRNIAAGKGPVQINYGGDMVSRSMPASMAPLGMYADEERRRGDQLYAQASTAGWVPDEVKVQQARQRSATTDYLENRARQSDTIADEMAADADPYQRRREALIDQGTKDQAFNESYPRVRGTMAQQAADKVLDATAAKTADMDLLLTHPLAKMEREAAERKAQQAASMDALGRIFTNPENYAAVGGVQGIPGLGGRPAAGQVDPTRPAAGQPTPGAIDPQFSADMEAEFRTRFNRSPTPQELQTLWNRYNAGR